MSAEITLKSASPPLALTISLGDGPATVTAGYGGWSEIARPGRVAMTSFQGAPAMRMTVPILFDGYVDRVSVEPDCRTLERMAARLAGLAAPPVLRLSGPVPHTDLSWVIDAIDWTGEVIRDQVTGNRLRQLGALNLLQWVQEDELTTLSPAQNVRRQAAASGGASHSTYTARAGDTLTSIAAAKKLDWHTLATLNSIRDPKAVKVGQVIKLP